MATSTKAKVTRVKASDDTPKKTTKAPKTTKKPNIFVRLGRYFKGAWTELRQVRWPNRRATWSLTVAVTLFTLFFVVLILLLDTFFKYIFQLIIS